MVPPDIGEPDQGVAGPLRVDLDEGRHSRHTLDMAFVSPIPATLDVLRANRRFPKGIVKRYGDEIIEVVQRAASRPEWGWPAFIRHRTPEARQLAWLRAYALIADEVNQFAAPLVMPNRILERLVLSRPASRTEVASTLGSWRDRLCGDDLWKAMQGQLQLRLDGSDASISMDDHGDP